MLVMVARRRGKRLSELGSSREIERVWVRGG